MRSRPWEDIDLRVVDIAFEAKGAPDHQAKLEETNQRWRDRRFLARWARRPSEDRDRLTIDDGLHVFRVNDFDRISGRTR